MSTSLILGESEQTTILSNAVEEWNQVRALV